MRNPIHKFSWSSIVFGKSVFCLKNWKFWRAPTTIEFNVFCWNFAHASYLSISTKGCSRFFFLLFRSWVISKKEKRPGFYILVFYIVINNSRSKQNKKKSRTHFCRHWSLENVCKSSTKISNFVIVGADQSFQFFWQIVWFLGNDRALSKFRYQILYNLITITKL